MRRGRKRLIIPFLMPAMILYSIFFVYPSIQAFYVSFHKWSGFIPQMKYIGLDNFRELIKDDVFWISLKNTAVIVIIGGLMIFFLSFLFTGILSSRGMRGKKFFRAVLFFPNIVPAVALGILWIFIYNYDFGIVNEILRVLHLEILTRVWLGPDLALFSVLIAVVWTYVGFYIVILLAGVDKIPPIYYEAAIIDGANGWQMFFKITIPLLRDIILVAVVLWTIGALKMFDLIFAMTEGGPSFVTHNIAIYLYTIAFGRRVPIFKMGYGTAMAVVLFFLVIVSIAIIQKVLHREVIEY